MFGWGRRKRPEPVPPPAPPSAPPPPPTVEQLYAIFWRALLFEPSPSRMMDEYERRDDRGKWDYVEYLAAIQRNNR